MHAKPLAITIDIEAYAHPGQMCGNAQKVANSDLSDVATRVLWLVSLHVQPTPLKVSVYSDIVSWSNAVGHNTVDVWSVRAIESEVRVSKHRHLPTRAEYLHRTAHAMLPVLGPLVIGAKARAFSDMRDAISCW